MNVEFLMTKDERIPKPKAPGVTRAELQFLTFGLSSSFVIRHSSFSL